MKYLNAMQGVIDEKPTRFVEKMSIRASGEKDSVASLIVASGILYKSRLTEATLKMSVSAEEKSAQ